VAEWLEAHAWKTNPATLTERYGNISSRNGFNDFPPQNASRCEPVNVAVCRRFRGDLTQFLHSSADQLQQRTWKRTTEYAVRGPDPSSVSVSALIETLRL
jgi:hypothetical protein